MGSVGIIDRVNVIYFKNNIFRQEGQVFSLLFT